MIVFNFQAQQSDIQMYLEVRLWLWRGNLIWKKRITRDHFIVSADLSVKLHRAATSHVKVLSSVGRILLKMSRRIQLTAQRTRKCRRRSFDRDLTDTSHYGGVTFTQLLRRRQHFVGRTCPLCPQKDPTGRYRARLFHPTSSLGCL